MKDHDQSTTKPGQEDENAQPGPEYTPAKPDLNECFEFDVGYCKPPRNSWFVKGASGNPAGRPKGSKNKPPSDKKIKEIFRSEIFKDERLKDGRTLSVLTAVTQTIVAQALRGNLRASQLVLSAARTVEEEDAAQQEADFLYALEYKSRWKEVLRRVPAGQKPPIPVPNPDNIILDHRNRRVMFIGPRNEEEMFTYLNGRNLIEEDKEAGEEVSESESDIQDADDECPEEINCENSPSHPGETH